jgi:hypothetical protein
MERVKDVRSLVSRLGRVIYAPNRRAALKRAGTIVDAAIPAAVRTALSKDPLGMAGRRAAAAVAGPTVPISVTAGDGDATTRRSEPLTIEGFDVVGTVFLSSFEEIFAKLWEALEYPQDVPPADVAGLFDVALLRSCFSGVPDGAELGPMLLPAPPRLRVVAPDAIELTQRLRARLVAPGGGVVELVAVAAVRIPLVILAHENRLGLELNTILLGTRLSFQVDPGSALQPLDAARLEAFTAQVRPRVAAVVEETARKLDRSPVFDVPGGFGDSKLRIVSASLWLSTWNHQDQVTFGVQVEPEPQDGPLREAPTPDKLAPLANLFLPDTIAIIVSESLVERGLRAVAATGRLDDLISKKLEWLRNFELPTRVEVRGVDVRFEDEVIKVGLDCRYLKICAFATDLDFRATVSLRPEIIDGQLRLKSDGIHIHLGLDSILCTLSSPLTGPFGFILLTIGSVIAVLLSPSFNRDKPAFWQGERLPNSDVFPRIDLGVAGAPTTGIMHLFGTFGLVPDEASTFVATQVLAVSEETGEVTVVEGATVELSELGLPPPPGDDYVPPADFISQRTEDDGTIVRISTSYRGTSADVPLGAASSERHGLTRFAVQLDDSGGLIDVTVTRISPSGPAFTIHDQQLAPGDAPDLAVTVTLGDGYQPLVREPIAINLAGHRLGTVQEPVRLVYVDGCLAERRAVTDAQAKIAKIQEQLNELRAEYDRAPPSEKDAIGRAIRRMENNFLKPATAALAAARAARETCRTSARTFLRA